ncbi:Trehalose transport system permease protein SugB [Frondihabitans sp. 762G35]|uniref:carbohydrate ABC transporter permease n=1 Tax=Frondihabitans sp. 762G35 TaxID=1446794 RepID=UPI000D2158CC|nr:carbohydrate ABC transporter permease [Frondihabitans sp. 762G35]ARC57986.1 Trehalose transport system permease protein SugB [Frondihabitans sp. 762G35]
MNRTAQRWVIGTVAIVVSFVVFLVPFVFIILQAAKDPAEAADLSFSLPTKWVIWQNLVDVLQSNDGQVVRSFINSGILTVASVAVMVVIAAMVGYVLQRKPGRLNPLINFFVLAGLIVPPAVVPTIWVLQGIGLFKTLPGMILIEATFGLSFCILLFRAFVATIPRELDEAAVLDGSGPIRLFFTVVLPLLRPVVITVILVQSVAVFNDFAGPLYFLPGADNSTVQLTLYNFQSQTLSQYNLLFMDVLLITIPPLILYIFFNRQIVAGMTSGAIKG